MTRLVCLEPRDPGPAWEPFRGSRPVAELRAGAWRIRERWGALLGIPDVAVMGDHLPFADAGAAPLLTRGLVPGPAIVVRSDFAPGKIPVADTATRRYVRNGRTVGWMIPNGATWSGEDESGPAQEIEGVFLGGAWELVTALETLLAADCAAIAATGPDPVPAGVLVLGDPGQVACFGAEVEPGVVFDVRQGAVVLEEGVRVLSGTRLEGPLFAGEGSVLLGGVIRNSTIGPRCRVHGEVGSSVFLGFANKSHDGFVGHSVIGQWANLGAGTITSNLKNTYGNVRLDLPGGPVETGRMNLGTLFGDHAKIGIGTMLSAGTIIGAGAQVVARQPPRYVAPFAWGDGPERLEGEAFIRVAKRVMPRRQVTVTPEIEASLRALHARLAR